MRCAACLGTAAVRAGAMGVLVLAVDCRLVDDARHSPATPASCPTRVVDAVGQHCYAEGLLCAPEYPCGIAQGTLTCTCTRGVFVCTDVTGNQLNPGDTPACPASKGDGGGVCPASESAALFSPCTTAQVRQTCRVPRAMRRRQPEVRRLHLRGRLHAVGRPEPRLSVRQLVLRRDGDAAGRRRSERRRHQRRQRRRGWLRRWGGGRRAGRVTQRATPCKTAANGVGPQRGPRSGCASARDFQRSRAPRLR